MIQLNLGKGVILTLNQPNGLRVGDIARMLDRLGVRAMSQNTKPTG